MKFLTGYRKRQLTPEHKFEYINLRDFNDKSFVNVTAYIWIYLGILISLACVAADTYTAITLLVFNRWSSQIKPAIPFEVAKIIFAVCIIISYVLIIIDWFFALNVIRRGGVADAYMNVIALRWNCVWGGKGGDDSGWRRFNVFARLTKERGKTDYLALVTYFSFKGWVRIVFAEGPRVVINALTLASVVRADLLPKEQLATLSLISKFFENIQHLYQQNKIQVFILGSMAFTTILWVFAIIQLLLACLIFLTFLWRHMHGDALRKYCKDRIDKRMSEIVVANHRKGLKKDNEKMQKAGILRAPTIPVTAAVALEKPNYEKPSYAMSVVQSPATASPTSLRPAPPRQPMLPNLSGIEQRRMPEPMSRMPTPSSTTSMRPPMGRSQTVRSDDSYGSKSALVSAQAPMGYDGPERTRESIESLEYAERQQQWVLPPVSAVSYPHSSSGRSDGGRTPAPYAQNGSGRSDGGRMPAPYAQNGSGRSDGGRTPAPYAQSSSGRSEIGGPSAPYAQSISGWSDGGSASAPRAGPDYPTQDFHSPSPQRGRLPFATDHPGRQQMQGEYGNMPPSREQNQSRGPNQGQFAPRPGPPSRSNSGGSNYGPRQERFPIAVRAGGQQQQERFPIAVRTGEQQGRPPMTSGPRGPQQQYYNGDSPLQMPYYNNGDSPQRRGSPFDYYSQQGQEQQDYYPSRRGTPQQQIPQMPQPVAYEYIPPHHPQQPQYNQRLENSRLELPRLQTQNTPPSTGGYKRPTYTPASATVSTPAQESNDLPVNYFQGREDPLKLRSATAPPDRQPVIPFPQPVRSASARPDIRRDNFEAIKPVQRSATYEVDGEAGGRRL